MYQVLLVDDEPAITASMRKAIGWAAHQCEVAAIAGSGKEALDIINSRQIDIVITDIRMQQMGGLELCQILFTRYPRIQIIVISGYAEFSYAQKAIKYGILGYCLKPLEYEEIDIYLNRAVSRLQSKEQTYNQDVLLGALLDEDVPLLSDYLTASGNYHSTCCCAVFTGSFPPDTKGSSSTLFRMGQHQYGWFSSLPLDQSTISSFLSLPENKCIGLTNKAFPPQELPRRIKDCQIQALQYFIQPDCTVSTLLPDDNSQDFLDQVSSLLSIGNSGQLLLALETLKNSPQRKSFSVQTAMCLNNMICSSNRYNSQRDDYYIYSVHQLPERYRDFSEMLTQLCMLVMEPNPTCNEQLYMTNTNFIRMMEYLNQNYTRNISTNDLAQYMHMNPSYLSKIFKQEAGTTVTKYLTSLRIHKSCQMLNSGNYSISEIASATGFNDYFYFLKTFKKITGVTPRQYQLGEGTDLNLFSGSIPV